MPAHTELIVLNTLRTSLVFSAQVGAALHLHHFGARLRDPRELLHGRSRDTAFPAFGPGVRMDHCFRLTHSDGNLSTVLLFRALQEVSEDPDIRHLVISLEDPIYPVQIRLNARGYVKEDVIELWTEVLNHGRDPVIIQTCPSFFLSIKAQRFFLTHFCSGWGRRCGFAKPN